LSDKKQKTPAQPFPSSKSTKKGKGATELSRFIKRTIYDPATADEKRDDDALWNKCISLAKEASPGSLLRGVDEKTGNVLYKESSRGKGELTRTQFIDRVNRMRLPS